MPASVLLDSRGPDWPLGSIVVVTPGIPVNIMSLVDPLFNNDPATPTNTFSNEYAPTAQQIQFQGMKVGASGGLVVNTGNIYICRTKLQGTGNRSDPGCIVATIFPGQTFFIAAAPMNMDVLNPYRYKIDADNANDAAQVTLYIG